jgi:hypothetical protein
MILNGFAGCQISEVSPRIHLLYYTDDFSVEAGCVGKNAQHTLRGDEMVVGW